MIRRFDRRIWVGGALLAINGGMVNAVGLSCFARQTISHVTGTTTLLALALARGDLSALIHFAAILGSFAAGAVVAGFVVRDSVLQFGPRYAVALALECLILVAATLVITRHVFAGLGLAASACGLQNAMAGTYSGASLRTTHMTGIVTDLGAAAGHVLRGVQVDWLRVRFHALLLGSFLVGAAGGGLLFAALSYQALYVPAGFTAALTLAYLSQIELRPKTAPAK